MPVHAPDTRPSWAPPKAEVLFDGPDLRAYIHDPDCKRLTVGFDNFRPSRAGFPDTRRVQYFKRHNYATLRIDTAHNDWFLSPDLPRLKQVLAERTAQYRHRASMGFSMGGFGTLLFARTLKLRQVLLVSPQISVLPDVVPWDSRYQDYAKSLDPRLDDVMTNPYTDMSGVVLFDSLQPNDWRHARLIEKHFPGITAVASPFGGHPASAPIVEAGLFDEIRSAVAGGLIEPERFKALRRQARGRSQTYARNIDRWLKRRSG